MNNKPSIKEFADAIADQMLKSISLYDYEFDAREVGTYAGPYTLVEYTREQVSGFIQDAMVVVYGSEGES